MLSSLRSVTVTAFTSATRHACALKREESDVVLEREGNKLLSWFIPSLVRAVPRTCWLRQRLRGLQPFVN